jgi:hypothetical protein
MTPALTDFVSDLLRDNQNVCSVFQTMRERRIPCEEARAEIGRAFLGCLWEMERGLPNRWLQILDGLREGRSTAELFPKYWCEIVPSKSN